LLLGTCPSRAEPLHSNALLARHIPCETS